MVTFNEFLNEAKVDKVIDKVIKELESLGLPGEFGRWGTDITYIIGKTEIVVAQAGKYDWHLFPDNKEIELELNPDKRWNEMIKHITDKLKEIK